jgi:prepilin-type N-terminal cleavage/methylation domain-containing protein/prepilin-type processing-associated H-X9-DG protein
MNVHKLQPRSFTLIELLVVIAIISLLVAVVVPSLSRAKQKARDLQCLTHLKAVYVAFSAYVGEEGRLPPLNNEPDEGAWQYNYLIYDGRDFESNFGPIAPPHGALNYIEQLYCPIQEDPYNMLATEFNPWPVHESIDTRAGYSRRYGLSGKAFSQLRTKAMVADLLHLPEVIRSGHKTGVNVVFTDGHGQWVDDPGILTDNELAKPFDPADNDIIKEIWQVLDHHGRDD